MKLPGRGLGLLAVALAGALAVVYLWITRDTAERHAHLEAQLRVERWLTELAFELSASSAHRLFPNRAELSRKRVSESRRPTDGVVTLSRKPLAELRALELETGAALPFSMQGERELTVGTAGPVLIEYAVDELTVYWVEKQRFYRQRRGSEGRTELAELGSGLPVESLTFTRDGDRVRIALQVSTFRGVHSVTIR